MHYPVQTILFQIVNVLELILVAYVILSWVRFAGQMSRSVPHVPPGNPIVRFIEDVSEAMVRPIRRLLAPYQRGIPLDLSVLVVFLLLELLKAAVIVRIPF
jgi:uncharacterized protein YggT (Ycf19 family)